jgi:dTDP-4-dehydrorhamnose reductase
MTRILVTGVSGLLGINLALQASEDHTVLGVVNQHPLHQTPFEVIQSDLGQPGEMKRILEQTAPEIIFNCAALANLDSCEEHPDLAKRLNSELPETLASLTRQSGIGLVHISTDAVFNGQRGGYREGDRPEPINVYARTKLAGEQAVLATNPDALVARVNFYGWSLSGQRSLAEFFFNNLSQNKPVNGFTDVFFCPLLVNELVDILFNMITKGLSGLYHVVSSGSISKHDFGMMIASQFGFSQTLIKPVSWKAGGLHAVRSPNLTLNVDKLTKALGCSPSGQNAGIQRFYEQYRAGYAERISSFLN